MDRCWRPATASTSVEGHDDPNGLCRIRVRVVVCSDASGDSNCSRRPVGHPGKPSSAILAPNDVWAADFKGQFKTGDGRYCYPLTVTDAFSRFLLGCQGLHSTAVSEAKPVFTRLFKEYGLPKRIRTDNGVPFATTSLARLSTLSAWWVRLGILPELIEPGKPQQNGRHERMHRTLKAETTGPPAGNLRARSLHVNGIRPRPAREAVWAGVTLQPSDAFQ